MKNGSMFVRFFYNSSLECTEKQSKDRKKHFLRSLIGASVDRCESVISHMVKCRKLEQSSLEQKPIFDYWNDNDSASPFRSPRRLLESFGKLGTRMRLLIAFRNEFESEVSRTNPITIQSRHCHIQSVKLSKWVSSFDSTNSFRHIGK